MSTTIRDDKMWKWQTEQTYSRAEIGQRNRLGAEVHYIHGPISFSSEYFLTRYTDIDVFDKTTGTKVISGDGNITSWSTWVSYFLTGESKTVSNFGWRQPNPKVDFDPVKLKGTGAWEVLARYTHTDVSDKLFDRKTFEGNPFRVMDGAPWTDEYTAGINWTWNPMVRWQINYTHITAGGQGLFSGDKNNLAGEGQIRNEDMAGMRMIFKF
jgi:phosphate-selective porin